MSETRDAIIECVLLSRICLEEDHRYQVSDMRSRCSRTPAGSHCSSVAMNHGATAAAFSQHAAADSVTDTGTSVLLGVTFS